MATTFTKQIQPQDGNWQVIFGIGSKDPADVTFAQMYGDLQIDTSGSYVDTITPDPTFTFSVPSDGTQVWSDILLNKLPNAEFIYTFNDASILPTTRYRMATIFAAALQAKLTAALTALRAMTSTPIVNSTFTV
jgi:hypothetical protein